MSLTTVESNLQEQCLFESLDNFSQVSHIKSRSEYNKLCDRAHENPERF